MSQPNNGTQSTPPSGTNTNGTNTNDTPTTQTPTTKTRWTLAPNASWWTRMGRDGKEMGPNDATRRLGLVYFVFYFSFLLTNIYLYTIGWSTTTDRPTQAKEGQRGPTQANEGQRKPTRANEGQRKPTKANEGPRKLTKANNGQWQPTKANNGQRRPTTANEGQRRPMRANEGLRKPTRTHASQRRPTRANTSQRRPMRGLVTGPNDATVVWALVCYNSFFFYTNMYIYYRFTYKTTRRWRREHGYWQERGPTTQRDVRRVRLGPQVHKS
jgi:hypothetical protein